MSKIIINDKEVSVAKNNSPRSVEFENGNLYIPIGTEPNTYQVVPKEVLKEVYDYFKYYDVAKFFSFDKLSTEVKNTACESCQEFRCDYCILKDNVYKR